MPIKEEAEGWKGPRDTGGIFDNDVRRVQVWNSTRNNFPSYGALGKNHFWSPGPHQIQSCGAIMFNLWLTTYNQVYNHIMAKTNGRERGNCSRLYPDLYVCSGYPVSLSQGAVWAQSEVVENCLWLHGSEFFLGCFWLKPKISSGAWGTPCGPGTETGFIVLQGKHFPCCTISLVPFILNLLHLGPMPVTGPGKAAVLSVELIWKLTSGYHWNPSLAVLVTLDTSHAPASLFPGCL